MQLHEQFNMTPFRTGIGFCQDGEGRDLVLALLKATFHFAANGPIAAAARDGEPLVVLSDDDLALPDGKPTDLAPTRALKPVAEVVNVRFIDAAGD